MLKRIFELDTRSLGLFRILFGLLLMLYCMDRFIEADVLFSDWGIMPRTHWISEFMSKTSFSFHLASGQIWFQRLLILIQGIAAFFYMIGYRPKFSGFVSLILMSSLQSRNNLILSCCDDLMRLALLWSLFLPLGKTFGIQQTSSLEKTPLKSSIFNAAILLQLLYIYIFTAVLKYHPIWVQEGSAVYYALNIDIYTKPLGVWLRSFTGFMQFATFGTMILEVVGPIMALVPGWSRFIASAVFIIFHMGLFLTLELDFFPWVAAIYWVLFWPEEIWSTKLGQKTSDSVFGLFNRLQNKMQILPTNPEAPSKPVRDTGLQVLCGGMLILTTLFNINTLSKNRELIPKPLLRTTEFLYLYQSWDMFAPYPIRNDGWFVIEGTFTDGTSLDLVTNESITYNKPVNPAAQYSSGAMRKFMVNVWDKGNRPILLPFARHLCRKYSVENGRKSDVEVINIMFMKETTPAPGERWREPEKVTLWNHNCFAK